MARDLLARREGWREWSKGKPGRKITIGDYVLALGFSLAAEPKMPPTALEHACAVNGC